MRMKQIKSAKATIKQNKQRLKEEHQDQNLPQGISKS